MDRSDNGYRQRMDLRHYLLPLTGQVFCFLSAFRPGNHVDIGPGNKVIRLCRDKYQATYRFVFADLSEHRTHLNAELGLQGVHLFVGYINGDNSHVIKANSQIKCRCRFHYSASRTIAAPRPPAAQAVTRPKPPPRRRSSCKV
ncbi:Uncharacterised protein [Enterobacter cloacae]|nr:Uncharacterised protein [Enterobacter cloacae]